MRHKFLCLSFALVVVTTLVGLSAIITLIPGPPDNSDKTIQPKPMYVVEQDPVKVKNNLIGICIKEMRILSREELYQRAIADMMRKMLESERKSEEKDRKNGFHIFNSNKILMSSGAMTRKQFIQRAKKFKTDTNISPEELIKILGMEPVLTVERFGQRLKETGNKLIVVQHLGSHREYAYVTDYSDCCAVLSEEETKQDGALYPDQDPSRKEYDPENAKKSGYGLFYLRSRIEHINLYTGKYTVERPIYNPVSNCGEIIYGFCLTQPIIGTPLNR